MPKNEKNNDQFKSRPFKHVEGDFQEYVAGKQVRRRRKVRRWLRFVLTTALFLVAIALGFTVMETLLRVSEIPLPTEAIVTEPVTSVEEPATLREPEGPPMRSFYIPIRMLDRREQSRELMDRAEAEGTNTAVMTFKDGNGWLSYKSNLMQQSLLKSNAKARYRTDWTLYDMKRRAEQRVIAVIHCFDDPLAAGLMLEWSDGDSQSWLSPWSEPAREYLLGVVREVAAFNQNGYGVDDILLCGVRYPARNEEEPEALNAVLRDFIAEAKEAAGEDALLYVMIDAADAQGESAALGGDLWDCAADYIAIDIRTNNLSPSDRIWKTRPVVPVIADAENAGNARDYIVLVDDAQG